MIVESVTQNESITDRFRVEKIHKTCVTHGNCAQNVCCTQQRKCVLQIFIK